MQVSPHRNLPSSIKPSFVVDGMLGSTVRKLRILGFDTLYDSGMDDMVLLETVAATGRILVTNDAELFLLAKRKRIPAIRSGAKTECDRLYEILATTGQTRIDVASLNSRCTTCNGALEVSGKLLDGKVVFVCTSCGKNYWRGGHWKKLEKLFSEVNLMLDNSNQRIDQ
jgi:uncharacterized protein with PIN domain